MTFIEDFNQLDCFNSNWRQKSPPLQKNFYMQARNILTNLRANPTRQAWPDLQHCFEHRGIAAKIVCFWHLHMKDLQPQVGCLNHANIPSRRCRTMCTVFPNGSVNRSIELFNKKNKLAIRWFWICGVVFSDEDQAFWLKMQSRIKAASIVFQKRFVTVLAEPVQRLRAARKQIWKPTI